MTVQSVIEQELKLRVGAVPSEVSGAEAGVGHGARDDDGRLVNEVQGSLAQVPHGRGLKFGLEVVFKYPEDINSQGRPSGGRRVV